MSEEIEARARGMGWAPKEEFRGDPEKWIDAETYVKRGEELMPILKANNKRLEEKLHNVEAKLTETETLLKASQDSIEALKEFNTTITRKEAKLKREELKEALVEARREGDVDKELELQGQIKEADDAIKEAEKPAAKVAPKANGKDEHATDPTQNPEWLKWQSENTWFGKDRRKTALALGIADDLKANEDTAHLTGRELLDKVSEEVEKVFGGGPREQPTKVEGGRTGSAGGKGKSYADLPADAKDACERQAQRLVGPGRAFKSTKEWREHYAASYYAE